MKEYLITFPKNEDWRYLRDREGLLDQYADSLKIFLDKDIEDLLMDGLYEEAYEKLCSKFPEIVVKRIQNDKATPDDMLLLNNVEYTCIKSMGNIFKATNGDISDYFVIKGYTLENPENVRALQDDELGRLYYASHPEEHKLADEILRSYGIRN
ncbi:MAG: hypothetical protein MR953_05765 [Butyrivibrio crossotus]|nr:hypothetical protein [Butyrivibrio crossotus]